jgi:hypothetical protein
MQQQRRQEEQGGGGGGDRSSSIDVLLGDTGELYNIYYEVGEQLSAALIVALIRIVCF